MTPPFTPEAQARLEIDRQLTAAGVETTFRDNREPEPRSRRIFTSHP
jgi:hypothetical protein